MDYNHKQILDRIGQAFNDDGEALRFLISEVEQLLFSRLKVAASNEDVLEIFSQLKCLRNVEGTIQHCLNEFNKETEEDIS